MPHSQLFSMALDCKTNSARFLFSSEFANPIEFCYMLAESSIGKFELIAGTNCQSQIFACLISSVAPTATWWNMTG